MGNVETWASVAPLLAAFAALGRDGDWVLLKVDGEREAMFFTVVVDVRRFGDLSYRRDGDDLAALLEGAIRYGRAGKRAPQAGRAGLGSTLWARLARAVRLPAQRKHDAENVERWRSLAPRLAALEALGRDGGVVLLQIGRRGPGHCFSVILTGKGFADASYRCDGDDLATLLDGAIRHGRDCRPVP